VEVSLNMEKRIKQKAIQLGFDLVGITGADPIAAWQEEALRNWLDRGYAGSMEFMHRNFPKRTEPARLFKGARSVIVTGLGYKPPHIPENPHRSGSNGPTGRIANYALYDDYHPFIKQRLYQLAEYIKSIAPSDFRFKACVDSAPLAERALAARAGLGFIGKNHMLINPRIGPELFLGELLTNLSLEADEPAESDCGSCRKCIDACPTGALRPDGTFDASRCINYLTIEHKGDIPARLAEKIDGRLFGCDTCVTVCPYNSQRAGTPTRANKELNLHPERRYIDLEDILTMTNDQFGRLFGNSTILRTGLKKLKSNAAACLDNLSA